jgi:hypothetical protein
MPYPPHEAQLERQALRDCLHLLRHPLELPSSIKASYHTTKEYYRGGDLVDLGREELIHLVAWTRRMGLKFAGAACLLLVALLIVALAK